jgi:hypothetical protein
LERAMRKASWSEADVLRVLATGGATVAVALALMASKFFYPAATIVTATLLKRSDRPLVKAAASELVSFVTSPTIDAKSEFFVGAGDGGNGYFGEQPKSARTRD